MFRRNFDDRRMRTIAEVLDPAWGGLILSGAGLISMAVLVWLVPQVLVALISMFMMMGGIALVSFGIRARQAQRQFERSISWHLNDAW